MKNRQYKKGKVVFMNEHQFKDCPHCGRAMFLLPKADLSGKEYVCTFGDCPGKNS